MHEIAASVADFGTILPILFAAAMIAKINLGLVLVFLAVWYVITGLVYRIPIPVEPMKAIGAIIIAGGATAGEVAASGITIGLLFLVLGIARGMKYIQNLIPLAVIRGVQLGLTLILLKTSFRFITADPLFSGLGITVIVIFFLLNRYRKVPDFSALIIIVGGIALSLWTRGLPGLSPVAVAIPVISFPRDFLSSGWRLVLPQVPLTIANAILATSLLAKDLFNRDVDSDKLSVTIGLMNLASAPLGGFPLCHGAGGMAAHYRFGGRTGGTNIVAGIILLVFAFFFSDAATVASLPQGMFGALLVFVALELGKHGIKTESPVLTGAMALTALFINMTAAFAGGLVVVWIMKRFGITVK